MHPAGFGPLLGALAAHTARTRAHRCSRPAFTGIMQALIAGELLGWTLENWWRHAHLRYTLRLHELNAERQVLTSTLSFGSEASFPLGWGFLLTLLPPSLSIFLSFPHPICFLAHVS